MYITQKWVALSLIPLHLHRSWWLICTIVYICFVVLLASAGGQSEWCTDPWRYISIRCFQIFPNAEKLTYHEAQTYCEDLGGTFATIKSTELHADILAYQLEMAGTEKKTCWSLLWRIRIWHKVYQLSRKISADVWHPFDCHILCGNQTFWNLCCTIWHIHVVQVRCPNLWLSQLYNWGTPRSGVVGVRIDVMPSYWYDQVLYPGPNHLWASHSLW